MGTAVGDSIGLPAEGLSAARIEAHWPGPLEQRLVLGRGMLSDDTEHTVWVARSLIECPGDVDAFQRRLALRLRWWLAALPAGVGLATLRAILKLWVGFPPTRSGVFSAGNGPAMRSAVIGVFFAGDELRIRTFVEASTRLTHTDPRAVIAALAVALTAAWATRNSGRNPDIAELSGLWQSAGPNDPEWGRLVGQIATAASNRMSVADFAASLGLRRGVTGYAYHSVPVALFAWWRHWGNFRASLESVVRCGGDTDTVGAITGALAGITSDLPANWIERICDYPISTSFLARLANELARASRGEPVWLNGLPWALFPVRNLVFLCVVLAHGARRLLPF